jgi:hypothetical protein
MKQYHEAYTDPQPRKIKLHVDDTKKQQSFLVLSKLGWLSQKYTMNRSKYVVLHLHRIKEFGSLPLPMGRHTLCIHKINFFQLLTCCA